MFLSMLQEINRDNFLYSLSLPQFHSVKVNSFVKKIINFGLAGKFASKLNENTRTIFGMPCAN